jgi:hypothetical protein
MQAELPEALNLLDLCWGAALLFSVDLLSLTIYRDT